MKEPDKKRIEEVSKELLMHLKDSGLEPHEGMASIAMATVQLALAMKVPKGRMLMGIDISYDVLSGNADVEEETCH